MMGIEAHVVILHNKLMKHIQSNEISLCIENNKLKDDAEKLELIYAFLMKDECQDSENYNNWKDRLRKALVNIEDKIETYLYNVENQRQTKIKVAPNSWVILKNKMCLCRAMKEFMKITDELTKDQSLRDFIPFSEYKKDKPAAPKELDFNEFLDMSELKEDKKTTQQKELPDEKTTQQKELKAKDDSTQQEHKKISQQKGTEDLRDQLDKNTPNKRIQFFRSLGIFGCSVVFGPHGVGKTAITRAVSNLAGIRGQFEFHVWVQMGKLIDFKQLLIRILTQLTHRVPKNPEDMDESELSELVYQELVKKSVLIVLEDVEELQAVYKFVLVLVDSNSGSHIIITTEKEEAKYLSPFPIKLEPLQEHHQPALFTNIVEKKDLSNREIIAARMAKSCGGLPLKIILLEKLLSHTEEKYWPSLKDKIEDPLKLGVYKLCYNQLPPHLKPCFLFLCLFPKSFPIPIRRILRLWIAEDLIQKSDKNKQEETKETEEIAESYLYEMIQRNLVDVVRWKGDGSPHTLHMNANLYDDFLPSARDIGLLDVHDLKNNKPRYVRWYVEPEYRCSGQEKLPDQTLLSSNVELGCPFSFVSFRKQKGILTNDLGRFIKILTSQGNLRLLRVLDLEGVYKPFLDKSLQELYLLRYLGLRSTGLDSLPKHIGALPYLETLDVKHTNISGLPSSIWKMSRIRHLDLNGFHFNETELRKFSRAAFLSNLRTLTGFHVACRVSNDIFVDLSRLSILDKLGINFNNPEEKEMEAIKQWIGQLKGLRSLKIEITRSSKDDKDGKGMLLDLSKHSCLVRIYLLGKLQNLDADILPPSMRVLTLSMSNLVKDEHDPMKFLGASTKFSHLVELRLLADCYKEKKMTCPRDSFPDLKVLKLWKLEVLEEIDIQPGSLKKLEHLEIRYCPKLKFDDLANKLKQKTLEIKELIVFNYDDPVTKELTETFNQEKFPELCFKQYRSRSSKD